MIGFKPQLKKKRSANPCTNKVFNPPPTPPKKKKGEEIFSKPITLLKYQINTQEEAYNINKYTHVYTIAQITSFLVKVCNFLHDSQT